MNLSLLTDDDLEGLNEWASPIATMAHLVVAAWGRIAWQAVVDEQRRRVDGGPVTPWPGFHSLPNEGCVLVGQLLAGIHDSGSQILRVWVEEAGEELVDLLVGRAEQD